MHSAVSDPLPKRNSGSSARQRTVAGRDSSAAHPCSSYVWRLGCTAAGVRVQPCYELRGQGHLGRSATFLALRAKQKSGWRSQAEDGSLRDKESHVPAGSAPTCAAPVRPAHTSTVLVPPIREVPVLRPRPHAELTCPSSPPVRIRGELAGSCSLPWAGSWPWMAIVGRPLPACAAESCEV
eukprot:364448-Chlamydomonas_euryale.AAC.6